MLAAAVLACMLLGATPAFTQCIDDCFRPSGAVMPFPNLSEVELTGRCATECAMMVLGSSHRSVVMFNGLLTVEELRLGGTGAYHRYRQCTLGCSLAPTFDPDSNQCRTACVDICEDCSDPQRQLFFRGCLTQFCKRGQCNAGCTLHNERFDTQGADVSLNLPPPPLSFSASREDNGRAGNFEIAAVFNLSDPSSSNDVISAFIFKVEDGNQTSYVLRSSLTEELDLSYFSCQEVNLSLAVVNTNGSSPFTSPTTLCVHGGPPLAPPNFTVASIADDLRPDFYGHAVISFEWDIPEGASELTGYQLVMDPSPPQGFTDFCGIRTTFQIDKNATNYTVMASSPNEYLRFGVSSSLVCVYEFTLESLPGRNGALTTIDFERDLTTDPVPPIVRLTCTSSADRETGLHDIRMEFTYTNVSLIHEAINTYSIVLRNLNTSNAGEIATSRETLEEMKVVSGELVKRNERLLNCGDRNAPFSVGLTETGENITGFFSTSNFCPQDERLSTLYIQLRFTVNVSREPWWRPLPDFPECSIVTDVVPPGPVSVESINLQQDSPLPFTLRSNGQRVLDDFSVSWSPPEDPYGDILSYTVYVGSRLLEGSETNGFIIPTNGNETLVTISNYSISSNPPPSVCLFLQIRSDGEYTRSNWSAPFYLPIEDNYTPRNCTFILDRVNGGGDDELSRYRAGVIAEAVIIFCLLLLLVGLGIFFYFKPQCCRRHKPGKWETNGIESGPGQHMETPSKTDKGTVGGPMGSGWEIPLECIVREYQLGDGSFGTVAKGYIRGPVPGTYTMKNRIHASIAIKFLKDGPNDQERQDFANEILLMKRIGFAKHPNVVGLFGCVTVSEPVCILLEYLEYGDLLNYLEDINKEVHRLSQQDTGVPVSVVTLPATSMYTNLGDVAPDNLLSFAYQIASGMEFLGGLDIIHRDLACRNILLGDKKILKISDFGLSREGDIYVKTTGGKLPYRWMALESLQDREFTVQSDVWAYGVVLWEIATLGMVPYPTVANEDIMDHILEGNRLEKPSNCSNEVYEQMQQCWKVQPVERPTFSDLKEQFEAMLLETANYLQFTSYSKGSSDGESAPAPTVNVTPIPPENPRLSVIADMDLPLSDGFTELIVEHSNGNTDAIVTLSNGSTATIITNGKYVSGDDETIM